MIVNKPRSTENIRFGRTIKSTIVSGLNTVEEGAGSIQDAVITLRSSIELIHGALQEPIIEQRIDLAKTVQKGLDELKELGMSEQKAKAFLQID